MDETQRNVKVNHLTSAREVLEGKHSYTLELYSAVAQNFGNMEAFDLIESILQEREVGYDE